MRYLLFATDYDGTLASRGRVLPETQDALQKLARTGVKLVLVTGREISELLTLFPNVGVFNRVVGENGALVYDPKTQETRLLTSLVPRILIEKLEAKRVFPLSVGQCIVGTLTVHEKRVQEAIQDAGLLHQIILNKESLMILPAGVSKKTGLEAVLEEYQIPGQRVVCAGDAENDLELFKACGFKVAVQNALPLLKQKADLLTEGSEGKGVCQLITQLFL